MAKRIAINAGATLLTFLIGVSIAKFGAGLPYPVAKTPDKCFSHLENQHEKGEESQRAQPSPSTTPVSAIHKIDFRNFTYPAAPIYPRHEKSFTLRDGEYTGRLQDGAVEPYPVSLVDTVYGDVTGDGVDDVILVLTESVRGSAIPYYVYIYGVERQKPKLLWSFYAGERGDGGLRRIVADHGEMVVELYGRDRVVNGGTSSDEDNMGVCCPRFFTRSRYEWRDGQFRLKTKEAALPNPQGNAAYLPLDK